MRNEDADLIGIGAAFLFWCGVAGAGLLALVAIAFGVTA